MSVDVKSVDLRTALYKGIVGALPVVGPLAAEAISNLIPNQRLDRISRLLQKLDVKVKDIETSILETKFKQPEFVDFLEDGLHQATRALSDERLEYIAASIKNGISGERLEIIHRKKLLSLLAEINEIEVFILKMYDLHGQDRNDFIKQHKEALTAPRSFYGAPLKDIEQNTIHQTYKQKLVQLGLLKNVFKKTKKGEVPEFDENTGMIKSDRYEVTSLGRLLLVSIDQAKSLELT